MALSILHRITGVALVVGSFLLIYWLAALATGPAAYATASALLGSVIGQLLLLGWTFALFFHLCNGIRHLFWDMGRGLELGPAAASATAVVIVSVALTIIAWIAGSGLLGG